MLDTLDINFSVVAFSGFLAFLLGVIWYHPKILGTRWMQARSVGGAVKADNKSPLPYIGSFFLWMLSACFYAFLAQFLGIDRPSEFFLLSCLLWVAFSMPSTLMSALYTGYPLEAMAIEASYQLGGYYVFAAVHIAFLQTGML